MSLGTWHCILHVIYLCVNVTCVQCGMSVNHKGLEVSFRIPDVYAGNRTKGKCETGSTLT